MSYVSYDKTYKLRYDTARLACAKSGANAMECLRSEKGGSLSGLLAFYPIVEDDGNIGVGLNPPYYYLKYQNNGIRSFPMLALKGQVVPMMIFGRLVFRKVSHVNEWKKGGERKTYWRYNQDGELFGSVEPARRWVHTGMAPKLFINRALEEAIAMKRPEMDALVMDNILKECTPTDKDLQDAKNFKSASPVDIQS